MKRKEGWDGFALDDEEYKLKNLGKLNSVVTHDLSDAPAMTDRIVVTSGGK
jgi:ABC-type Fe3+/spermidine/putrescine transport system ATPase subunit